MRCNAFLRDMNVGVRAADERRIEVLAQDLPCFLGAQLAIDITLRCALSSSGETHPDAADFDGAVLARARVDKRDHVLRIADREVSARRLGHRNGRPMEQRSHRLYATIGFCYSPKGSFSHVFFDGARVGTALDADVVHGVLLCFLLPLWWNRPVHNLLLDRWRATFLGGISRARPAVVVRACVC